MMRQGCTGIQSSSAGRRKLQIPALAITTGPAAPSIDRLAFVVTTEALPLTAMRSAGGSAVLGLRWFLCGFLCGFLFDR